MAIKALDLVLKPKLMSFAEAAGLPIAATTAIAALDAGGAGAGSWLLIHAAAGGGAPARSRAACYHDSS